MADKELRRMNRTELIEIIYALEQNEQKLQEENDKLAAELDDRKIRLDQSGSIAEAALSLNHIFEDAQAAADQYLESLQSMEEPQSESDGIERAESGTETSNEDVELEARADTDNVGSKFEDILESARSEADKIIENARQQEQDILEGAQKQADEIVEESRRKANEYLAAARESADADAARQLEQTNEQCEKERQAVQEYHDKFLRDMSDILKENPELLERVRELGSVEGEE